MFGYVFRTQKKRHPYDALKWNPPGQSELGKSVDLTVSENWEIGNALACSVTIKTA